eukprot:3669570-Alexandrium_andersonii.AAC.1
MINRGPLRPTSRRLPPINVVPVHSNVTTIEDNVAAKLRPHHRVHTALPRSAVGHRRLPCFRES